jgi:hypothetical protein
MRQRLLRALRPHHLAPVCRKGRPYRRPIRITAVSAISRGSLRPVAPASITLRATNSQSGSLRSTTLNERRA